MPLRVFKRPLFDAEGPFLVRSAFLFNGRMLRPGEPFPHEKIPKHKLAGLYRRRKIDMTEVDGKVTDESGAYIGPHWSTLDDKEVLKFVFMQTGTRRRNPDIARAELAALEATGELNAWSTGGATS
jgi:hypothetical protein